MKEHIVLPLVTTPIAVNFMTTLVEWQVRTNSEELDEVILDSYPLSTLEAQLGLLEPVRLDAWQLRDEFLSCSDLRSLQDFLNKSGEFGPYRSNFSHLGQWQELIRALLGSSPENWAKLKGRFSESQLDQALLVRYPRVEVQWRDGLPTLSLLVRNTLHAMVVATQVDYLRGKRFRFCRKPDCGRHFEITSMHKRWYCCAECARHENIRKFRARHKAMRNKGSRA